MNLRAGVRTDVGKVRGGNEDSYVAQAPLFAVADGMGGHRAGDVASATAVDVITQRAPDASVDSPESLSTLLRQANRAIWEKARSDPSLKGMGTTCTLILIDGDHAELAHVGDSRAYLLRDGHLEQLTEDHTLVGRMVKEGRLRQEEAERHPQRSIITRALGVDSDVEVDVQRLDLRVGDRLLLNSDGLTGMLDADAVESVLNDEADPQAAADKLVSLANDAGGEDNITVVVVDVTDEDERSEEEAAAPAPPSEGGAREDTEPGPKHSSATYWRRRFVVGLVALVLLCAGGYVAARYFLHNSWYVGASDDGYVAIFRGIPEEIAGLDFKTEEETTEVALDKLPASTQENVREGIKVDSRDEAEETVGNLRSLAKDFGDQEPAPLTESPRRKRRNF